MLRFNRESHTFQPLTNCSKANQGRVHAKVVLQYQLLYFLQMWALFKNLNLGPFTIQFHTHTLWPGIAFNFFKAL